MRQRLEQGHSPRALYEALLREAREEERLREERWRAVERKLAEYEEWSRRLLQTHAPPPRRVAPGYRISESPLREQSLWALGRATLDWAWSHTEDPDFWRNFYGAPFVRMFGERLEALPPECRRAFGEDLVLVQPYELPTEAGSEAAARPSASPFTEPAKGKACRVPAQKRISRPGPAASDSPRRPALITTGTGRAWRVLAP
ncbi:MAG TPA: hypothetical protein VLQ93_16330 [Myxococcaceae bacterium]|nr:hypothetical protein [Myxococcaceae bacterium]